MTVQELIEKLRLLPPHTEVVDENNYEITEVELDEDETGSFVRLS